MAPFIQLMFGPIQVDHPEEPDNEKVVRGSRDGFTENIVQNTALIRRRIRDANLRFELHQVRLRSNRYCNFLY